MTKKDYILLATVIKNSRSALQYATTAPTETKRSLDIVRDYLATALEKDNPRFDIVKFLDYCNS